MEERLVTSGVVYLALNKIKYLEEAKRSASSLRNQEKDIHITLITNLELETSYSGIFSNVIVREFAMNPFKAKVKALSFSPYDNTLFLDTDTIIKKPINHVFSILNEYDLALAKRPSLSNNLKLTALEHESHFNTGLILYRRSEVVLELFQRWFSIITVIPDSEISSANNCDQTIFNYYLIDNQVPKDLGISIIVLQNSIWNVRPKTYKFLKKKNRIKEIVVLHARDFEIEPRIVTLINRLKGFILRLIK